MRDKPRTHGPIAALAERQHGVVSASQLADLGYSTSTISRDAIAGRLHEIHRGVYAVGHRSLSRQGLCLAAVLTCGDGALASHHSAAWLWGLTTYWRAQVDVTAPTPRHQRSSVRMHSAQRLQAEDISASQGVPVTAVPRTLLDFAATEPRFLAAAVDRSERLGLLDIGAIDQLLARSRGQRGAKRLRLVLSAHRIPAFTRSNLERRFLKLVRDAGLPKPSMNLFIEGYELDAYWSTARFAIELDTYDYHGDRRSFETDRLRQEDLKLAGIEMVRITGPRLDREPGAVIARLRRLLAQRHRELASSTKHPSP